VTFFPLELRRVPAFCRCTALLTRLLAASPYRLVPEVERDGMAVTSLICEWGRPSAGVGTEWTPDGSDR
jgi:hypothetical protein